MPALWLRPAWSVAAEFSNSACAPLHLAIRENPAHQHRSAPVRGLTLRSAPTRYGRPACPCGALVYPAPHGQAVPPPRSVLAQTLGITLDTQRMQSVSEQIVIGVVGGVITTALLSLLGLTFWKVVVPWYRNLVYQGADVTGTWEYRYDQPDSFGSMTLTLRQSAHRLEGDASVRIRSPLNEENLLLDVQGTLWEGYASMTLKSKDRRVIAFSTLLLKVMNNGASLEGIYAFREPHTDRATSNPIDLRRQ